MHQYLYAPGTDSRQITHDMIDGLAGLRELGMPRRIHAALVRRFLREQHVGTLPGRDVATDLGVEPDRPAEIAVSAAVLALRATNELTRIPAVQRLLDARTPKLFETVVARGLDANRSRTGPLHKLRSRLGVGRS